MHLHFVCLRHSQGFSTTQATFISRAIFHLHFPNNPRRWQCVGIVGSKYSHAISIAARVCTIFVPAGSVDRVKCVAGPQAFVLYVPASNLASQGTGCRSVPDPSRVQALMVGTHSSRWERVLACQAQLARVSSSSVPAKRFNSVNCGSSASMHSHFVCQCSHAGPLHDPRIVQRQTYRAG
jgi:hypothetical protein